MRARSYKEARGVARELGVSVARVLLLVGLVEYAHRPALVDPPPPILTGDSDLDLGFVHPTQGADSVAVELDGEPRHLRSNELAAELAEEGVPGRKGRPRRRRWRGG